LIFALYSCILILDISFPSPAPLLLPPRTIGYQIRYTTYDIRNTRPVLPALRSFSEGGSAVEGYARTPRISKTYNPHRRITAQKVCRTVQFVSTSVKKCSELFKTCKLLLILVNFYPHFSRRNTPSLQHPHFPPAIKPSYLPVSIFPPNLPIFYKPCLYSPPPCYSVFVFPPFGTRMPITLHQQRVSAVYRLQFTAQQLPFTAGGGECAIGCVGRPMSVAERDRQS
jgi:hypothetical protein